MAHSRVPSRGYPRFVVDEGEDGFNAIHALRVPTPSVSGPGGRVHKQTSFDELCVPTHVSMMPRDLPQLPPKAQNLLRLLEATSVQARPAATCWSESAIDGQTAASGDAADADEPPPPRPPKTPIGNVWAVGCADRGLSEQMVLSRHESVGTNFVVRFSPRIAVTGPILSVLEPSSRKMYHLPLVRDPDTNNYSIGGFQFDVPCRTLVALIEHLIVLSADGHFTTGTGGVNLRLFKGAVPTDATAEGGGGGSSSGTSAAGAIAIAVVANAESRDAAPALSDRQTRGKPARKTFKQLIRSQLQPQRSAASSADPFCASFDYEDLADEAVQETLLDILLRKKRRRITQQFQRWLEEQIVPCSMDDKAASITHLLRHVNEVVRFKPTVSGNAACPGSSPELPNSTAGEIAVCFCGNPALAQVLQNSVDATGCQMEFSTDSHAA